MGNATLTYTPWADVNRPHVPLTTSTGREDGEGCMLVTLNPEQYQGLVQRLEVWHTSYGVRVECEYLAVFLDFNG